MRPTSIPILHAERFTGQVDESAVFQLIRGQQRVPAVLLGRRKAEQFLSLDPEEVNRAIKREDPNAELMKNYDLSNFKALFCTKDKYFTFSFKS